MRKQLKRCLCHLTSLLTVVMMVFTVSCSEDELAAIASVDLDLTSLTFDATSSSQVITIKSNRMWTLTVDETAQEWLSLSRTSGENDGTVEVTVLANNGDNRSTSITMIAGGKSTSIQVTQEGANPVTTLWYEPFGTVAVSANTFVDEYDGFAKDGVVGAGVVYTGVTTSVRTSGTASTGAYTGASGVNNLFFGAATASFTAENIVVKGASQLTLTFGATMYAGSTSSDTYSTDAMKVYVKAGDGEWKALTYTHGANTSWEQASIDLSSEVPSETESIAIKFECSFASAYRLDDVKLTALGFKGLTEPIVSTTEASDVTGEGAVLSGSYINYGEGEISEKGFMYKTGAGEWVSVQVTTEAFTCSLTGLSAMTEYTYKAYVVKNGTTYEGGEKSFTTKSAWKPTVPAYILLSDNFEDETSFGANWFMIHTEGTTDWYQWSLGGSKTLYMSSYYTTEANTCYAVSPTLSLSGATDKVVSFDIINTYTAKGTELNVYSSTDFAGDITKCTLNELSISLPASTQAIATVAYNQNIDLSSISCDSVYIIFKYKGSKTDSKTTNFGIDNFLYGKKVSKLIVSPTSFADIEGTGANDLAIKVTAVNLPTWKVESTVDWITTTQGDTVVKFNVAANDGEAREGKIVFSGEGVDSVFVAVSQKSSGIKTLKTFSLAASPEGIGSSKLIFDDGTLENTQGENISYTASSTSIYTKGWNSEGAAWLISTSFAESVSGKLNLAYDVFGTKKCPANWKVSYSTDKTNWTSIGTYTMAATAKPGESISLDFTLATAVTGDFYIKIEPTAEMVSIDGTTDLAAISGNARLAVAIVLSSLKE